MNKKNLLLIILNILFYCQLSAMTNNLASLDTFPDFKFNSDDFPTEEALQKLYKTGRTVYQFFGVEAFGSGIDTLKGFERVEEDGRILSFRRFFPQSKVIAEEYTRFKVDTFIYVRYSETEHQVVARGKVVPTICCQHIDTMPYMELLTFQPSYYLVRTMDWAKEGFWQELQNNRRETGEYANNQRIGHWNVYDRSTKKLFHHQYVAGKLISNTPDNALEINDKNLISKALQGVWYFKPSQLNDTLFFLEHGNQTDRFKSYCHFKEDQVEINIVGAHAGSHDTGHWTLDDKNQLRFEIKAYQHTIFRLKYLGRYEMEWQLEKK